MRKWTFAALVLLGLCLGRPTVVEAQVKLHGLFTDNMVLQRDMKCPIWGTSKPGDAITVEFRGQTVNTKADDKGKWMVVLAPLKTGQPEKLVAAGTDGRATIENVLVGDVWLCTGQSNMEWTLSSTKEGKTAIPDAKNPNIRLFDVPKTPNNEPQTDLGAFKPSAKGARQFGRWCECEPDVAKHFSGVGYYFGRALQKELNVPIGLINSSWGGTAAERWTSKKTMDEHADLKGLKGSDLYNGMIVPLQPFAFKGVIWYQGESNDRRAAQYLTLFSAMIENWRADWKQDFPFLFVQLAPYERAGGDWPALRESQLKTLSKVKNTGMAVITDCGDRTDIHPQDKTPVGERLALAARALAYGQKIVYSGPVFESVSFNGDKATVKFTHVGGGLVAKGEPLSGWEIAGKDGKFTKANATIVENTVVVNSPDVAEPTAVRFGWANFPVVNFYNREGLPATPFRTDSK